jgi:NADPH:quinone reductase-like Zn-dependent oxidoreductase
LHLPIVPGVAFVGRVLQTARSDRLMSSFHLGTSKGVGQGDNMFGLKEGDQVLSLLQVGANSRHLCIASNRLVKVPDELLVDTCAVACLPEICLTAFQVPHIGQKNAARYRKKSLAGKSLLILGGATAMGRALIESGIAGGCEKIYAITKESQF